MKQYCFSFGPNGSVFYSTPYQWSSRGIPTSLRSELYAEVDASNHSVGIGPDGEWFYARVKARRHTFQIMKGAKGNAIYNWLSKCNSNGDSDFCVAYGPDNSWVGCTSKGAASWGGMPDTFDTAIRGFHPIIASIGLDKSYVMVNGSGQYKWNLKGNYSLLDQVLRSNSTAIEMVALNPYDASQFIILFKNGSYRAILPEAVRDSVKQSFDTAINRQAQINAQTTSMVCQNMLNMNAQTNQFLLNIATGFNYY